MNLTSIFVIDLETTGLDTTTCGIYQFAAKVIDPRTLDPVEYGECNFYMRPPKGSIDPKTVAWHSKRRNVPEEQILAEWDSYPDPKVVWPEILKFIARHHTRQTRQTIHSAPIPAGANIIKYDLPIIDRYNALYGEKDTNGNPKELFSAVKIIDLTQWFFPWFENNGEVTSYSMDDMRDYLGMPKENAHDALQDVKDSAKIIIWLMKLTRQAAAKVKFKGIASKGKK